ncbi:hypothetical protein NWP21_09095 [Anabaenopsis sp. FSS-46]|uniref:hypothetical protein n=1 Tax=Nostocales TaxID=1161 RepID=UPI00232C81AB|nr:MULTISPECIES: hypothetical protein [Nostocales]MDB9445267.1 hypothetical protein [Anabaena sp. CS-542/02]MDH6098994.1 hypothetical protein [Anabaenopsis sp. FSS-46]
MLKELSFAVLSVISFSSASLAEPCDDAWGRLDSLNPFFSSAKLKTKSGLYKCKVIDVHPYHLEFDVLCDNGSSIHSEWLMGQPIEGIEDGEQIFVRDRNGSEFKMEYNVQPVINCDHNRGIMSFDIEYYAYQKAFQFTLNIHYKLKYRPLLKPAGF